MIKILLLPQDGLIFTAKKYFKNTIILPNVLKFIFSDFPHLVFYKYSLSFSAQAVPSPITIKRDFFFLQIKVKL